MSTKFTEHLSILSDRAAGLLNRAYHFKRFEVPAWGDPEYDSYSKKLASAFPTFPDKLARDRGLEFFTRRATEVKNAYGPYYHTFTDIIDFNTKALQVLTDMAKSAAVISLDTSPELYHLYISVFVGFAKINLLLSSYPESARPILASYARAHAVLNGLEEPSVAAVAAYLVDFQRPIERLRALFEGDIAKYVGGALLPLYDTLSQFHSADNFKIQRVFSVLSKSEDILSNRNEKTHAVLLHLWPLRYAVMWGYLLCPSELAAEGSVPVLLLALGDVSTLVLHRDELFDVYTHYKDLFNNYELKQLKFKLSRHKEAFNKVCLAFKEQLDRREEMRRVLVSELSAMLALFQTSPAALAPRTPMVLAALRLARDEIIWYTVHRHVRPHRAPSKWTYALDPHARVLYRFTALLSDLIIAQASDAAPMLGARAAASLRALYPRHAAAAVTHSPHVINPSPAPHPAAAAPAPGVTFAPGAIEWYYRGQLAIDAATIRSSLEALNKANPLSPAVYSSVEDAVVTLDACATGASPPGGLDAFRVNVFRAISGLLSRTSGVSLTSTLLLSLTRALNAAVSHSRFVDQLGAFTLEHASLEPLRWWVANVEEDVRASVELTAGGRDAVNAVYMVRAMMHAGRGVHRVCPEEGPAVGGVAMKVADDWLRLICETAARQWFFVVYKISISLGHAIEPMEAVTRMAVRDKSALPPMPGFESALVPRNPDPLRRLRSELKALQDVAFATSHSPLFTVYTSIFSPREYFITSLHASVREIVRNIVRPASLPPTFIVQQSTRGPEYVKGPTTIQRPTVILSCLSRLLAELQRLDRVANINALGIGRHIILSEFTGIHPKTGGELTGAATFGDTVTVEANELAEPCVTTICDWYVGVLSGDLDAGHFVHSPLYDMFQTIQPPVNKAPALRVLAPYTDRTELTALARLLGPNGIDLLLKKLYSQIAVQVQAIFTILAANGNALSSVRGRFTELQAWISAEAALKNKEGFLTLLISCGALLEFRDMVQAGLAAASRAAMPDVTDALDKAAVATVAVTGSTGADARGNGLRVAHEMIGGPRSLFDDVALKDILRRSKTTVQNAQIWSLLPEMFCLSMHAPTSALLNGSFTISDNGHSNNAHLMVRTLRDLVVTAVLLPPDVPAVGLTRGNPLARLPTAAPPEERARYELERVLDLAAFCTLNVNAASTKTVHPCVMSFIEAFVEACGKALPMSKLERTLPYTLMRTNFIQQYETQFRGDSAGLGIDDDVKA